MDTGTTRSHNPVATILLACALAFGIAASPRANAQAPAAAPATGTSSISGVVVDATSKQPLANAIVVIGAANVPATRLLTDSKGRFVVRNIPASTGYQVSATKQGYFGGADVPVAIADGQWVGDRRIPLVRHGVIAGTVIDENGQPVVAAPVRLLLRVFVAGRPQLASGPLVKTDDRGIYRVTGLRDGRYVVEVVSTQNTIPRDPGATMVDGREKSAAPVKYRDDPALDLDPANRLVVGTYPTPPIPATAYPITFYPGVTSLTDAGDITLAEGERREGIDIQLRPSHVSRVSGRVDVSDGSAVAMVLRLAPAGLEDLAIGNETATTVIDRSGRFTFLNVPDGHYVIDARSSFFEYRYSESGLANSPTLPTPGFAVRSASFNSLLSGSGQLAYAAQRGSSEQTPSGRADVLVAGRDIADVVLTMVRGVTLNGRVEFEDPTQTVSAFTSVSAQSADGSPTLGMASGQFSQGAFSINGLRPGRYVIRAGPGRVKSIVVGGKDVTTTGVDLTDGTDLTGVFITLTDKMTSLTGSVRGIPADVAAAVVAFPVDRAQWTSYGFQSQSLTSASVSTIGGFRLSLLPAGDYYVVGVPYAFRNGWQDPRFLERVAASATMVSLNWGDTKSVEVKFTGDVK